MQSSRCARKCHGRLQRELWARNLSNFDRLCGVVAAAFSDHQLGLVLAEKTTLGLDNSTIVLMTADHGWGLGEHNHWIKYTNWETDTRVPLFVHVPWAPETWGVVGLTNAIRSFLAVCGSEVNVVERSV